MADIALDTTSDGGTVAARVGDVAVLRLHENPTTGYRWEFDAQDGVDIATDAFVPASKAIGSGGERVITFELRRIGAFHVRATLRRSWEQGVAPRGRFGVTLRVS